jgi:hypothetical protein
VPEADNLRLGDDARRDAYEVWYLTWNEPVTGQGFWLRYITEPGRGELWFARFDPARPERTFGIHKRFAPPRTCSAPFSLELGGAHLGHDRAHGSLAGGGHAVSWDLRWDPAPRALRVQPDLSYRLHIGTSQVITPNPRVPLRGAVVVDGETLALGGSWLGQSHVFGTKHLYTWAWAHCAELDGAESALLELIATRLYRRGVLLPVTCMLVLELDGQRHHLNQFRHFVRNRASWHTGRISFSAWSRSLRLEGELACAPEALVQAEYEDPDGTRLYCANTEIGDARITVTQDGRKRHLEAHGRAHFETGGRKRDPVVTRDHSLV